MMSNTVHSYDKNTKDAMVAYIPQPATSRGSNSFDRDNRVAMAATYPQVYGYTLAAWVLYPVAAFLILHASWYKC